MIYAWLALHGCSLACGSGIIANLEAESGLNPCIVGASGVGLPQWAGSRRRRLIGRLGRRWCEATAQLDFMLAELAEFGLRDRLFAMTDAGAAATFFMREYEKPASRNPSYRMRRARQLYEQLGRRP